MLKSITSRDNPHFKACKRLADSSRERRKTRQTLLDGVHLLQAYVERHGLPRLLLTATQRTAEVEALLTRFTGIDTLELPPSLFAELSPVATPSGLLALVDIPVHKPAVSINFGLMLEDIQDPGNLGSLLRSAAAAGVDQVWLSTGCADAWAPKTLRGGQGAHFLLTIIERADLQAVAGALPGQVLAASLGGRSLFEMDLSGPMTFMIGNEGAGLSPAMLEAATERIAIPMPGGIESLNAAAAAAICLFEKVRQQR